MIPRKQMQSKMMMRKKKRRRRKLMLKETMMMLMRRRMNLLLPEVKPERDVQGKTIKHTLFYSEPGLTLEEAK